MAKQQEHLSSVHNAIRILHEFSDDSPVMGISELSNRLQLAKSTVYRLLNTLSEAGLIDKDSSHKYRLGIGIFVIGSVAFRSTEIRAKSFPILVDLMTQIRRIVRLAIYDSGAAVYLCKLPEDKDTRMFSSSGKRVPCHSTAVGKLLLAYQGANEIDRVLSRPMKAITKLTITDAGELRKQLQRIREVNYAVTSEESTNNVCSLAIPVYDHLRRVVAALSITGSKEQFVEYKIQEYLHVMRVYSRLITEQLEDLE
ncbi:IclR family transcriptional regulator [Alicyclobacillus fastidiosus]|uniref:IclR family transcriptional regulator n=1 Tax=Alicyclobacillus fastidiosus TaxID=392011 RepID=A0ABY6ZQ10_9BACL|nr:IclR family transcriptional regulator [Alicyclobacillus fastidiosus]WAH44174.1 IclR family transcriptional regulator [Alicyclobacillus fastidiosus]GMA60486.1 IclR family transcriptional regulator [Alicyclobacillus fastidiosus]